MKATLCPECGRTVGIQDDAQQTRKYQSLRVAVHNDAPPAGRGKPAGKRCLGSRVVIPKVAVFDVVPARPGRISA